MSKFSQYLDDVVDANLNNPDWRFGQACFNVAFELEPEWCVTTEVISVDPFFNDNAVPDFLKLLRDRWEQNELSTMAGN